MTEISPDNILEGLKDKKGKEARPSYIAYFEGLVDLIKNDGEVKFLTFDGDLYSERQIDGITYHPPRKESLAFSLPDYHEVKKYYDRHKLTDVSDQSEVSGGVCKEDLNLFESLKSYHEESSELPYLNLYPLIVAWDFHTHLLEKFHFSPILFFAGLPEKGKSKMAQSIVNVSRRGTIKASITDAQLIREAKDQEATIFFDMKDFWKSIERAGSEDIILSRFERGLKVARVKYPEKGAFEDMVYYTVFGPTIIGSNEVIDQILSTRAVSIFMRQSKKDFKNPVDEKKGADLRNQLIAWRWAHFNDTLPTPEKIVSGRFGDIVRPLHQVVLKVAPSYEDDFEEAVKDLEKRRAINKADSLEGELVQLIISSELAVNNGILPVKYLTDVLNEKKTDREKLTYQKIGRKLDVMGYQKARTANGASAIEWSFNLNEALAREHNVEKIIVTPSASSETSETSGNNNNNKEEDIDIDKAVKELGDFK